jgi:hypothetical protein
MSAARRLTLTILVWLCGLAGAQLLGAASALAAPEAPKIEEQSVADVASTSATFAAQVNPGGAETSYRLEYAPAGGAFKPVSEPAGSGSLPEGTTGVQLSVHVQQGLAPGASYEFRLVVSNSVEKVTGEAVSFTTQGTGAFALPDGRQWELVSPPDKHGALFEPIGKEDVIQAADTGDAITYAADAPTESAPAGYDNLVQILSGRTTAGWTTQDITPPQNQAGKTEIGEGNEYRYFSADLARAVLQPFGPFTPCQNGAGEPQPCLSPHASEQTAFLRTNFYNGNVNETCTESCYRPLVTGCPSATEEAEGHPCPRAVEEYADVSPGTVFGDGAVTAQSCPPVLVCGPQTGAATPDLSDIEIEDQTQGELDGEWTEGRRQPYEAVLPAGEGGATVAYSPLALLNDGSTLFSQNGHLYRHDLATGAVLRLDAAQGVAEPEGTGKAQFLYVSSDSSTVFFSDPEQLTSAAGGGVYACRIVEAAGKLACELELTPLEGASVFGTLPLIGASEDGSYLYFHIGNGLYVEHHEGSSWKQTFIAAVAPATYGSSSEELGGDSNDWTQPLYIRTSRVSPNGQWFAFMSQQSLTGYDNLDAVSGRPDEEVYLYDAARPVSEGVSGVVDNPLCASCNPTGARPHGKEYNTIDTPNGGLVGGEGVWTWETTWLAANVPAWTPYTLKAQPVYQSRYLSDSGRLFFNSSDALVPKDINGQEDVYEFEPAGVPTGEHGCSSASLWGSVVFEAVDDGCVALISSGESGQESAFLDASESGGDVFFLTTSKLTPQDTEGGLSVYDARECTGSSPCLPPAKEAPPACDTEASCRAAPSPQPAIFGAPASATFSGAGNLVSPPAIVKPVARSLTGAQKLAVALKACARDKSRRKRASCEKRARKKQDAGKSAKQASYDRRVK